MRRVFLGDHAVNPRAIFFHSPDGGTGSGGSEGSTGTGDNDGGDGDGDSDGEGDGDGGSGDGNPGGTKSAPPAGDKGSQEDSKTKKLNQENKSLRTRLRALEAEEEKRKRDALSEADRLKLDSSNATAAATAAQTALREERGMRAVERLASKLDLDADLASRLVRISDLEFDDDGKVTNAEDILTELVEKWPRLKNGAAAADTEDDKKKTPLGPSNPSKDKTRGKIFTREQVEAMSNDELNANWETVAPLLQAGALNRQKR